MISPFAQSIGRLYRDGRVTKEKVDSLYKDKKLTAEEYEYILGMQTSYSK